ncbi:MAG: transcriptional regulator GcvA [Nitrospira sp.]|jgi:LysR family glycine cleavage system transcriptional activator|nr:transcriptional regulator GcvA [Nitrospira sp.]
MRRLPPLNAVHTFEAAARHLSFNRAAEELHVTPSAVSHQVRTLEEFLGVRLFNRLARQVVLTTEGQVYLPPIRAALDQIDSATERVAAAKGSGPLTMSISPTFATGWLVPRLSRFQVAHPSIEVRLNLVRSITELVDFSRSDVDLVIRYGDANHAGLRNIRLIVEELVPVCSPALLEGPTPLRQPQDLRRATLLHALPRVDQWRQWLKAAGVSGVNAERGPKFHNTPLTLEGALAGMGVALADRRLVARELRSGRLVAPFDITLPSESAYYLIYPEEREDDSKIAAFRDWLLGEVARSKNETEIALEE